MRSNCIKSNDIAEEGSEGAISRAVSSLSVVTSSSSPSRTTSSPSRTSSGHVHFDLILGNPTKSNTAGAEGGPDDREVSFSSALAARRSQTLVESVAQLTIDTGRKVQGIAAHLLSGSLHEETNGSAPVQAEQHGEEEEDEDDEGSDWDESDDWSDEEDLGAFELEVASFLAAVKHQSRSPPPPPDTQVTAPILLAPSSLLQQTPV